MDIEKRVLVHQGFKITEGQLKELHRLTEVIKLKDDNHKLAMTARSVIHYGLKVLESKVNPASQKEIEELITKEFREYISEDSINNLPLYVLFDFIVKLKEYE